MHVKIGVFAVILFSAATVSWAEPMPNHSQLATQVQGAMEKCDWKVRTSTGGPKALMLLHQAKMRKVLDELKAGQAVDPNEIAKVMEGHSS